MLLPHADSRGTETRNPRPRGALRSAGGGRGLKSIEQANTHRAAKGVERHRRRRDGLPEGKLVIPAVPFRGDESETPARADSRGNPRRRAISFGQVFWLGTTGGRLPTRGDPAGSGIVAVD